MESVEVRGDFFLFQYGFLTLGPNQFIIIVYSIIFIPWLSEFTCQQQCQSTANQWVRKRYCRLPPCKGDEEEFKSNCPEKYQQPCEQCLDTEHNGRNYVGEANKDYTGTECLKWSSHRIGYEYGYDLDSNLCRNLHLNGPVISCLAMNLKKEVILSPCNITTCDSGNEDVFAFYNLLKQEPRKCIFPFIWRGRYYHACSEVNGQPNQCFTGRKRNGIRQYDTGFTLFLYI